MGIVAHDCVFACKRMLWPLDFAEVLVYRAMLAIKLCSKNLIINALLQTLEVTVSTFRIHCDRTNIPNAVVLAV